MLQCMALLLRFCNRGVSIRKSLDKTAFILVLQVISPPHLHQMPAAGPIFKHHFHILICRSNIIDSPSKK